MSFLKQLLTPFVEFEDDSKPGPAKPIPPVTAPAAAPATPSFLPPPLPAIPENAQHPLINGPAAPVTIPDHIPTYSAAGTITEPLPEHQQYFERLIEEANARNPLFQGTDYKEFVDSKQDIDDIQDEAIKYQTAYNVLKSTGLTKEKLLSTGQEYLNVIGRDLNAFQSAHAQLYQKEVRPKEELIQRKAQELQTLTQRLTALKAEINQLSQEITLTKDKMNTTKNSFLLAGENKQREIQTELQKITQHF
jgi:chromosome segregation ATPase